MEYRELQAKLKKYRDLGMTTIKLSAAKIDLEAELTRVESAQKKEEFDLLQSIISSEEPATPQTEKESTEHFNGDSKHSEVCSDCNGSGYTSDGGNVFPCWCELGCTISDAETEFEEEEKKRWVPPQPPTETESDEPRTLPLNLSKKWFDMIASGEKKEEYRAIKPHYESRFKKLWTHIKFTNGYGSDRPSFTIELLGIEKGIPKPEWSEGTIEQGTEVFVLKLGSIVAKSEHFNNDSEHCGVSSEHSEICSDCNGSGYTNDGGNVFPCWCELGCAIADAENEFEEEEKKRASQEPIAWIDGEAVYPSSDKDSTEAIEVCNFCRGTGVYGGSPCFHCDASGFDEEDSESDYLASNLTGSYRMDADEKEDEGWWLEELDDAGLPKEDYIAVDDTELARLKANGQIWEYSDKVERWVPPSNDESVMDAIAGIATKVFGSDVVVKPWSLGSSAGNGWFLKSDLSDDLVELEGKVKSFLSDVAEKRLPLEQFEAICVALRIARDWKTTISDALAKAGTFHLFPPSQLLAWGFDRIIPQTNFLIRFRDAASSSPSISVNTKFVPNPEHFALLTAWASSYGGLNWSSGTTDDYQDEDWSFPSVEAAEQFREYCEKLEFVQSAKIDRIASNEPIPQQKLVELGMVS